MVVFAEFMHANGLWSVVFIGGFFAVCPHGFSLCVAQPLFLTYKNLNNEKKRRKKPIPAIRSQQKQRQNSRRHLHLSR